MAEHIEREAAIRTVVEAVDTGLATTSGDLAEILDDIPSADVEPVRHRRWGRTDGVPARTGFVYCVLCGFIPRFNRDTYNYCPNCGAKMDGEDP